MGQRIRPRGQNISFQSCDFHITYQFKNYCVFPAKNLVEKLVGKTESFTGKKIPANSPNLHLFLSQRTNKQINKQTNKQTASHKRGI